MCGFASKVRRESNLRSLISIARDGDVDGRGKAILVAFLSRSSDAAVKKTAVSCPPCFVRSTAHLKVTTTVLGSKSSGLNLAPSCVGLVYSDSPLIGWLVSSTSG